jgi:hypothetical protein
MTTIRNNRKIKEEAYLKVRIYFQVQAELS